MAVRKLEKPEWEAYFDIVTKALVGKRAEIEVASMDLGDQIEAEWLPLIGIAYDPKDDLLEIALQGPDRLETVDHLIPQPQEVWVDEGAAALSSLEIIDKDGAKQIVLLRDPLMLPAPSTASR
jgi:hypothetical protein